MIDGKKAILIIGDMREQATHLYEIIQSKGYFVLLETAAIQHDPVFYNKFEAIIFISSSINYPNLNGYYGQIINNPIKEYICDNKYVFYNFCKENNIPTPETMLSTEVEDENNLIFPVVCKPIDGSLGKNVCLVHNLYEYNLYKSKANVPFLIQEYIDTSFGKDYRIVCIGNMPIGAEMRVNENDFRSNLATGGKPQKVEIAELPQEYIDVASTIAYKTGLDIVGVDIMIGKDNKPVVCEANSCPGFKGLLEVDNKDIYERYFEYINGKISGMCMR